MLQLLCGETPIKPLIQKCTWTISLNLHTKTLYKITEILNKKLEKQFL